MDLRGCSLSLSSFVEGWNAESPPGLKDSLERPRSEMRPLKDTAPKTVALSPSTLPVLAASCMLIRSGPFLFLLCLPLSPTPTPLDSTSGEEWSAWSVCSATCGEGWQSRTRFCVSSSYSTQCSGPLREQRPCNNSAVCPGKPHLSSSSSSSPAPASCRPSPLLTPPSQPQTPPLPPSGTSRLRGRFC